ncbi:MAG: hypothetical protein VKJ24_09695 [Synechococcales bacterium]|nr:hypothetical protein [Synechococcales bacterium]
MSENSQSHTARPPQPLPPRPIGSYLVEAGLITPAQVDVALTDQQFMDGMRFGEVLVARGWIKQQTLDFLINRVIAPEQQRERKQQGTTPANRLPTPQVEPLRSEASQPNDRQPKAPSVVSQNHQNRLPMIRLEVSPNQPYLAARLVNPDEDEPLSDRPTHNSHSGSQPPEDDGVSWVG